MGFVAFLHLMNFPEVCRITILSIISLNETGMFVKELDGNDRNQIRYIIHCNKRVMSAYSILIQTDPNKTCTITYILGQGKHKRRK
jgi:hypothetical protein